ncbi:hypothetical protein HT102_12560 [Hoyosella sp. G463]|uniref:SHOCT domain-containing protein n=1 Tax=Lolliginicoccus lacisalsi TaxID=2742202 RepID=A0A927JE13_9ACTN|nr:hypothetical protein [Lolliginicoccus lacisalsi]MBD8507316.1 hypothetical protein [Lolliginicoccus lacisalsi]
MMMVLLAVVAITLLVLAVATIMRLSATPAPGDSRPALPVQRSAAEEELRRRFAAGELTEIEYIEKLGILRMDDERDLP